MEDWNFRVYKVIAPNGDIGYQLRSADILGEVHFSSGLEGVASFAKLAVRRIHAASQSDRVTIDAKPFHDFEVLYGLPARRCVALSQEEADQFWEVFAAQ